MMVLGLSVAPTGLAGCAKGVLNDQTVDSWGTIGSAEDTGTMPVMDGTLWCARLPPHPEAPVGVPGPRYCKDNGTVDPWVCDEGEVGDIIEPPPDGDAPKGCVCVPPEVHAEYAIDHIIGDDETPGGILMLYRDEIYAAAVTRCLEIIDETPGVNHNECENIIGPSLDADLIPDLVQSGGIGSCAAFQIYAPDTTGGADSTTAGFDVDPGVAELPDDSYTDHYVLSQAITWNSDKSRYDVDAGFFEDMLDNPGWLLKESPRVNMVTGTNWTLTDVSAGTVVYALGLRTGDRPIVLNGMAINTIPGVLDAYASLASASDFTLTLLRSGSPFTIAYRVE
ncbi:MAG: hypothetical protein IPH07_35625 [Deltaproteobacteria bacterium]|nr:hypothetical protein [Deltaproteobacteria bacterium]MBK8713147.1 hypothetical protein [Deltaproteobacteria bacterium]MBP7286725.1 hypothetical protein [Nannocystaceae bacterium]